MSRKFAILLLLCTALLVAAGSASAWQLQTRVASVGGKIAVDGAAQTSVNGTVYKTYADSVQPQVTITADSGYKISSLSVNGAAQSPVPMSPTTYTMGLAAYPGKTTQSVLAYFAKETYSLTTVAGTGGNVSPAGTSAVQFGLSKTVVFSPLAGKNVVGIDGLPAGTVLKNYTSGALVTLPAPADVKVSATFNMPAQAVTLTGRFVNLTASANGPITVLTNAPASLTATSDPPGATFTWSQTAGPGYAPYAVPPQLGITGTGATLNFIPTVSGTYNFQVVASGNGASATAFTYVVATDSAVAAAEAQCNGCHLSRNLGQVELTEWSSSPHAANAVMCYGCHIGAASGNHPGATPTATTCAGCHTPLPHGDAGAACLGCHNPHSTNADAGGPASHYNDITTGMYPASYVTSRATCADCHYSSTENETIRSQWAGSGHAATTGRPWIVEDFKTISGCVQCHTTTGFVAYATTGTTAAWGTAEDKTKEVLTCVGCHADVATGLLREPEPVRPYANDERINPDAGKSNICMNCHSGTRSGVSIKAQLAAQADFTNLSFIDPHHMAAGGALYGQAGYHFPGRTYSSDATHRSLGSFDASGPCIACHKNNTSGHGFIAGATSACAMCHGESFDAAKLTATQIPLANALAVLRAQLAVKGFVYSADYPHFTNTSWGVGQAGANTMGAAFNYALLAAEPGAFAHDPAYARQLIIDSIDYLDNEQLDDSLAWLAIPHLRDDLGLISPEVAASLESYKEKDFCLGCHGSVVASASPIASNAHTAHLRSPYGPGDYLGTGIEACLACHNYVAGSHINGSRDLKIGAGSACANCHAGTPPAWTAAGRLACTDCHRLNPAVLPNGVSAPYPADFVTKGHGRFAQSSQCTQCHNPDSSHISGGAHDGRRLWFNDNALCASCHDDAAKVGANALNMATHRGLACALCHDPHGTANPTMVRGQIGETLIDTSAGLVQTVSPYMGLCQVCHSATAHYRAGQVETDHPASGCLGCHPHRGTDAFLPTAGSCNSCHGYPPASTALLASRQSGMWTDAGAEKYAGGGGAHLVPQHVSPNAKAAEGWANCSMCHNGGNVETAPAHKMTLPVEFGNITINIDPQYGFSEFPQDYWEVEEPPREVRSGYCFSISCHMSPSLPWSKE